MDRSCLYQCGDTNDGGGSRRLCTSEVGIEDAIKGLVSEGSVLRGEKFSLSWYQGTMTGACEGISRTYSGP